jgi:hypothetical protein
VRAQRRRVGRQPLLGLEVLAHRSGEVAQRVRHQRGRAAAVAERVEQEAQQQPLLAPLERAQSQRRVGDRAAVAGEALDLVEAHVERAGSGSRAGSE